MWVSFPKPVLISYQNMKFSRTLFQNWPLKFTPIFRPGVLTIYKQNPEIPVGKSNSTHHSIWSTSEIMGFWSKRCILLLLFGFTADVHTFYMLSIFCQGKLNHFVFMPKNFHPRSLRIPTCFCKILIHFQTFRPKLFKIKPTFSPKQCIPHILILYIREYPPPPGLQATNKSLV